MSGVSVIHHRAGAHDAGLLDKAGSGIGGAVGVLRVVISARLLPAVTVAGVVFVKGPEHVSRLMGHNAGGTVTWHDEGVSAGVGKGLAEGAARGELSSAVVVGN